MAKETVRTAITDGEGNNKLLSVVQSTSDPTKYGLVICNPDGSPISSGGVANNGQATTWNAGNTAVDLGGTYDADIDITSNNGATIGISSYYGIGTYFRSFFAPSEINDASWGQYTDTGSSEFVASLASLQTSMRVFNGSDVNYFIVEPTTLYSNQYPNTRDESGPYRPRNVLYTDDAGYFRSSSLPGFWEQLKPADSGWGALSASTFATGTMSSSGLYTANAGITVASGNLTGTQCVMNVTNGTAFASTHSLTGTNSQSTISITQTWNTTGTPTVFTLNLNDTASNSNSLLMDLRKGGVSQFKINKSGQVTTNQVTAGTITIVSNSISPSVNGYILIPSTRSWLFTNSAATNTYLKVNEVSSTATTGTQSPVTASATFAPTSGAATMASFTIDPSINQTGGANGITRGLYVNPTLTAAADFRAIDVETGKTHLRDLKLMIAGDGLYVKEGTNATMGIATLVGGTVVVSTTKVTANSRIQLTIQSLGTVTVPTVIGVTARTAGTSFTITSANVVDTSTIAWMIIEPA